VNLSLCRRLALDRQARGSISQCWSSLIGDGDADWALVKFWRVFLALLVLGAGEIYFEGRLGLMIGMSARKVNSFVFTNGSEILPKGSGKVAVAKTMLAKVSAYNASNNGKQENCTEAKWLVRDSLAPVIMQQWLLHASYVADKQKLPATEKPTQMNSCVPYDPSEVLIKAGANQVPTASISPCSSGVSRLLHVTLRIRDHYDGEGTAIQVAARQRLHPLQLTSPTVPWTVPWTVLKGQTVTYHGLLQCPGKIFLPLPLGLCFSHATERPS
jgi:hypothetical protein